MADWSAIASLATAGGTLVLAVATFASVRTANRSARASERALLASIRPVIVPSRMDDPPEKVGFVDGHWVRVSGGRATAEATPDAVYLAIALRNVGNGIAVLDRWDLFPERVVGSDATPRDVSEYRRLTRDLYVPAGAPGFWQGAIRNLNDPLFEAAHSAIQNREPMTVDLLYADHEGGQRSISRIGLIPFGDNEWLAAIGRHWNLDRDDPR